MLHNRCYFSNRECGVIGAMSVKLRYQNGLRAEVCGF